MNIANNLEHQQGVTLLEVLIAILVLSFGLLGMLGLTANGIKITSTSHYRTIAAHQITTMADMIVANPYLEIYYKQPTQSLKAECLTSTGCLLNDGKYEYKDLNSDGIDDAAKYKTISNNDYAIWQRNISQLLPSGSGVVCLDETPDDGLPGDFKCTNAGRITIKICWNESQRIKTSKGGATGSDASDFTCRVTQF